MTPPVIHRVTALDLRVRATAWPFARARRAEIDAHFADKQREKPKSGTAASCSARESGFHRRGASRPIISRPISPVSWRGATGAFPDRDVFNGFGMGALRCCRRRLRARRNGTAYRQCRPDLLSVGNARSSTISGTAWSISPAASPVKSRRKPVLREADYTAARALGLRGFRRGDRDDPDFARRHARRGAARADQGQSRPAAAAGTFRDPSGAARRAI